MVKKTKQEKSIFFDQKEYEKIRQASDNAIIEMVQKGMSDSFREIEKRYQKKLFVYVYHLLGNKEETEDILQNVFVKTFNNIDRFDIKRKFSSWIYRIAHNESVNYLKRKSKRRLVSWEDVSTSKDKLETSSDEESPDDLWLKKELRRDVQDALDKIPQKYREVLVLRYFLNKTYDEMSDILGKPANTIGTLLNRAKKKLSQVIKKADSSNE
ncbi:MAG TPA: RNA polymerase sigma factor [Candidatus Moranbacteria bacterium]|nr:RNA polymerase sigma factor [Candidatus Moranbacteria bacterium]